MNVTIKYILVTNTRTEQPEHIYILPRYIDLQRKNNLSLVIDTKAISRQQTTQQNQPLSPRKPFALHIVGKDHKRGKTSVTSLVEQDFYFRTSKSDWSDRAEFIEPSDSANFRDASRDRRKRCVRTLPFRRNENRKSSVRSARPVWALDFNDFVRPSRGTPSTTPSCRCSCNTCVFRAAAPT